jgi:hypothetical protein
MGRQRFRGPLPQSALHKSINQVEPGWEKTLMGFGKELYEYWDKYLRPRGYRLKIYIVISLAECWATLT